MTELMEPLLEQPTPAPPRRRMPFALVAAFTLSGMAGLAYELVWTRYLALLVGHAAYAQVLVLAVYLGGTAVGSILVAERTRSLARPLRAYAWAEVGLGAFGMAFHGLYLAGQWVLYHALAPALESPALLGLASWSVAIALILPQAVLLGTTFPLMAAGLVRRAPDEPGRSVADVYRMNTLGGAVGVLLAGFAAVPALGLPAAAALAGVLNLVAAALARDGDAPGAARDVTAEPSRAASGASGPRPWVSLLLVGTLVSALASFLYEIGWVRMLSLLMGSATHAFELMLSAFLVGLGAGSFLVRRWGDRSERPLLLLGRVQWAMGLAALLTLPIYRAGFPVMAWLIAHLPRTDAGYTLFNVARYGIALVVMLPATILAGMTLPLFTATLLRRGEGERIIGIANGANTIGSLIGAVAGGLIVLPGLGLERTLALGAGLDMAVGVALLGAAAAPGRARRVGAVSAGLAAVLVGTVAVTVRLDRALLTSGVFRTGQLPSAGSADIIYYEDGATATVAVERSANGFTTISTNGKPDASLPIRWLQRPARVPVAHYPISGRDESTQVLAPIVLLAHAPGAKRAAVIGHGSGMSAQLLLDSRRVESLLDIEIEPAMILGSMQFMPANRLPFQDRRSRFVLEDARTTLAGAGEPLDLVFSEPSNPWVSGVASLFTEQFYQRVRGRMAEHAVFGQWFHLYEMEDGLLLSVLSALDKSFPDWSAWIVGSADILIVAGNGPLPAPDWSVLDEPDIRAELSLGPTPTPVQMESLRLFNAASFHALLEHWPANSDYRPLLDTRAERARFRRTIAEGLFSFASDPLDLPRILAHRVLSPLPYDSLPVTLIAPLSRRALAGYLASGEAAHSAPPDPEWKDRLMSEAMYGIRLRAPSPIKDWPAFLLTFLDVEVSRTGRSTGWIDGGLYGSTEDFLEKQHAPDEVRASIALLKGVRSFDFAAAAAAADRLDIQPGKATMMPAGLLLDASVMAYLGAGRKDDARRAYEALAPATQRAPDNARNLWLAAQVGAPMEGRPAR